MYSHVRANCVPLRELELDGDAPVWRIPATRMKMGEQHIVPLSRQVVALLKQLQPITGDGPLVSASKSITPATSSTRLAQQL